MSKEIPVTTKTKMKKNIILIGFMGCGKTTAGKILEEKLQMAFLDTDQYVEACAAMTIQQIFDRQGEIKFRQMETDACRYVAGLDGFVIATGGGIVKNPINTELLKKNGIVFYLEATPEKLYCNTKAESGRPLLTGDNKLETIKSILRERKTLYESAADYIIHTDDKNAIDTALAITGIWEAIHEKNSCN